MAKDELSFSERRREPRVRLCVHCALERAAGSAIEAETIDLGIGGMRVATTRPLATDELLRFALPPPNDLSGAARVMRHEGGAVYGLRFEGLGELLRVRLASMVEAGSAAGASPPG